MILLLRDLDGVELTLGIEGGRFTAPEAMRGEIRDLRHLYAMTGLADCHVHLTGVSVQGMIDDGIVRVKVLRHDGRWCGITFPEDRERAREFIADLVARGAYPARLWG